MSIKTPQVAVSTVAKRLGVAEADHRPGSSLAVKAPSGSTLWIGPDTNVSPSNGFPLAAGEAITVDLSPGEALYGVLASGSGTAYVLQTGA